jgi:hypothetical protein
MFNYHRAMSISKIRSVCARLIGMRYRELPFGTRREEIEAALSELDARKCGESGTPAFEVNNEYFRIGRRKLRVCTEDEMFVSLWGSRALVDQVYARVMESWEARRRSGV